MGWIEDVFNGEVDQSFALFRTDIVMNVVAKFSSGKGDNFANLEVFLKTL